MLMPARKGYKGGLPERAGTKVQVFHRPAHAVVILSFRWQDVSLGGSKISGRQACCVVCHVILGSCEIHCSVDSCKMLKTERGLLCAPGPWPAITALFSLS